MSRDIVPPHALAGAEPPPADLTVVGVDSLVALLVLFEIPAPGEGFSAFRAGVDSMTALEVDR